MANLFLTKIEKKDINTKKENHWWVNFFESITPRKILVYVYIKICIFFIYNCGIYNDNKIYNNKFLVIFFNN